MPYRCAVCGEQHDDLPDLGAEFPDPYLALTEDERATRADYTRDRCIIREKDGEHYFVRGVIPFPIHETKEIFGVGAWVSQSHANFNRYYEVDESSAPTFGWLVTRLAHYPQDTFLLKTELRFRERGKRPWIMLEPTNHHAAIEQREGISLDRAWEIVHRYME